MMNQKKDKNQMKLSSPTHPTIPSTSKREGGKKDAKVNQMVPDVDGYVPVKSSKKIKKPEKRRRSTNARKKS